MFFVFARTQFCKAQPKTGQEEEARIKAELERKKRANAQITLMDPKTSQNVGIALAKIRLSNEKVRLIFVFHKYFRFFFFGVLIIIIFPRENCFVEKAGFQRLSYRSIVLRRIRSRWCRCINPLNLLSL